MHCNRANLDICYYVGVRIDDEFGINARFNLLFKEVCALKSVNQNMIVQNYTYTGLGIEGSSLTIGLLANRSILLLYKGDKLLQATTGTPTNEQYRLTIGTGLFEFGNDIEPEQVIQIIWKNI